MRRLLYVLFFLALLQSGVESAVPQDATPEMKALLPAAGFAEGWVLDSEIREYDRRNIYDHINGEAEAFYPYGFDRAVTAAYQYGEDVSRSVAADIYRMGSTLDAFGIYSNYRYPEATQLKIGAEGFVDEYQLMFYADRYFIRMSAYGEPEQNQLDLQECARVIAKALPADAQPPAELDFLALEEVEKQTLRYVAQSLLGHEFLSRGLIGTVDDGEQFYRVFVVLEESEEAARQALERYKEYLSDAGAAIEPVETGSGSALSFQDPLHRGVILRQAGRYLWGAAGLRDTSGAISLIDKIEKRLK